VTASPWLARNHRGVPGRGLSGASKVGARPLILLNTDFAGPQIREGRAA